MFKEALVRLGLISLISIGGVAVILITLRTLGLTQSYAPLRHPIAQKDFLLIARGGASALAPSNTFAAFDRAREIYPEVILEVTAQMTADGYWVLYEHKDLGAQTDGSGRVGDHRLVEIQNLDAGYKYRHPNTGEQTFSQQGLRIPTLEEFLKQYPDQDFLLNVEMRHPHFVSDLMDQLDQHDLQQRVIVYSAYSNVLREIKKHSPRWLYGTDPATLFRASMMESLYIEPVSNLWTDIVMAPLGNDGLGLSPRMLTEIKRRKKLLILERDKNFDSIPEEVASELQGVATSRPEIAVEYFADRLKSN